MKTIRDLTPDPSNANRGTERGSALLETSIERYGLGRSIVADRNGVGGGTPGDDEESLIFTLGKSFDLQ